MSGTAGRLFGSLKDSVASAANSVALAAENVLFDSNSSPSQTASSASPANRALSRFASSPQLRLSSPLARPPSISKGQTQDPSSLSLGPSNSSAQPMRSRSRSKLRESASEVVSSPVLSKLDRTTSSASILTSGNASHRVTATSTAERLEKDHVVNGMSSSEFNARRKISGNADHVADATAPDTPSAFSRQSSTLSRRDVADVKSLGPEDDLIEDTNESIASGPDGSEPKDRQEGGEGGTGPSPMTVKLYKMLKLTQKRLAAAQDHALHANQVLEDVSIAIEAITGCPLSSFTIPLDEQSESIGSKDKSNSRSQFSGLLHTILDSYTPSSDRSSPQSSQGADTPSASPNVGSVSDKDAHTPAGTPVNSGDAANAASTRESGLSLLSTVRNLSSTTSNIASQALGKVTGGTSKRSDAAQSGAIGDSNGREGPSSAIPVPYLGRKVEVNGLIRSLREGGAQLAEMTRSSATDRAIEDNEDRPVASLTSGQDSSALEALLASQSTKVDYLTQELSNLQHMTSEREQHWNQREKELLHSIEELKGHLESLQIEKARAEEQSRVHGDQVVKLQENIDTLQQEMMQVAASQEALNAQIFDMEVQRETLERQREDVKREMQSQKEAWNEQLRDRDQTINGLRRELEMLRHQDVGRETSTNTQMSSLRSEISRLKEQVKTQTSANKALRDELSKKASAYKELAQQLQQRPPLHSSSGDPTKALSTPTSASSLPLPLAAPGTTQIPIELNWEYFRAVLYNFCMSVQEMVTAQSGSLVSSLNTALGVFTMLPSLTGSSSSSAHGSSGAAGTAMPQQAAKDTVSQARTLLSVIALLVQFSNKERESLRLPPIPQCPTSSRSQAD